MILKVRKYEGSIIQIAIRDLFNEFFSLKLILSSSQPDVVTYWFVETRTET